MILNPNIKVRNPVLVRLLEMQVQVCTACPTVSEAAHV